MRNYTQGTKVNEKEHLELLEKMNNFQQQKKVTYVKGATVEQVLKELESCDEVVCKLKDGSILRVRENVVYINGVLADHVEPTSDEKTSEYIPDYETQKLVELKPNIVFDKPRQVLRKVNVYTNIPISNSFTGEQRFKQILHKYLD
jgi:hypothetical protein